MPWKLTVRAGPLVERARFDDLDSALAELAERADALAGRTPRQAVDLRVKRFEAVQQVAARLELAGPERILPKVTAGIDVRGDGSTEAYVGRIRREVVSQRRGETPIAALRRELAQRRELPRRREPARRKRR